MKNSVFILIAALVVTWGWVTAAQALPRTFVAVLGDDNNDCSLASPCRTFTGAVPKTDAGGEITALDSGVYGVVTVSKALTLQAAPGVHAAMGNGTPAIPIVINAGASDVVVLRNLFVSRFGRSVRGIEFNSGRTLHIENCIVTGFPTGIVFNLGGTSCTTSSNCPRLFINDTIARNNGTGINVAHVIASLDNCRLESNSTGIHVGTSSDLSVRDSVIASNPSVGLTADGGAVVKIENCIALGNGTGIQGVQNPPPDNSFSSIFVSTTMISGNGTGITGGLLISFGNNRLAGNGVNGGFTSTISEQ